VVAVVLKVLERVAPQIMAARTKHRQSPVARLVAVLMATALASSGCAPIPRGPLEPLVVGTERYLTIQWQLERRDQTVIVWGYINNDSPYTFDRVRLLVDALDANGQTISQRIVWALGVLAGRGRNYFEAPMVPAPNYRVLVFSYDRIEGDGFGSRQLW
jgi:hypothetical protein